MKSIRHVFYLLLVWGQGRPRTCNPRPRTQSGGLEAAQCPDCGLEDSICDGTCPRTTSEGILPSLNKVEDSAHYLPEITSTTATVRWAHHQYTTHTQLKTAQNTHLKLPVMGAQSVQQTCVELVESSFTETELKHNVNSFALWLRLLWRQMQQLLKCVNVILTIAEINYNHCLTLW